MNTTFDTRLRKDIINLLDEHSCPPMKDLLCYLDNDLSIERRADLELHLSDCPACLQTLVQYREAEEACRNDPVYRKRCETDQKRTAEILEFHKPG